MKNKFLLFGRCLVAFDSSRIALWFVLSLFVTLETQAQERQKIPSSSILQQSIHRSVTLLLNPCLNTQAIPRDENTDIQQNLLFDICSNSALVEKIFKARFLQYASLALVNDPWNLDIKITAQIEAIHQCRDIRCLERELDLSIDALAPLYLNAPPRKWARGKLCVTDIIKASPTLLPRKTRETIINKCGGIDSEYANISTCNDSHGKLFFAICRMQGNQVNAPQWLIREKKSGQKHLFNTDDGPMGVLETTCNGMPDLLTTVRINAEEHSHTYYRFDGSRYQKVYGYTAISLGNSDDAEDFLIALGAGRQSVVVCR